MIRTLWITAISIVLVEPVTAHVVLQRMEGNAGYQEYVTIAVPHGCGVSPTTAVRVKIPEGILIVVPEPKAGWLTKIVRRKLAEPMAGEGGAKVTEVIDEVSWTNGNLPVDQLGLFTLLVRTPDAPGRVLFFKTIQKCVVGETKWVDTIAQGEPTWKLWARPAPSPFMLLKKADAPQLGATMQQIMEERSKLGSPSATR